LCRCVESVHVQPQVAANRHCNISPVDAVNTALSSDLDQRIHAFVSYYISREVYLSVCPSPHPHTTARTRM